MSHSRNALIAALGTLPLMACAGANDRYPSLQIRDAERASGVLRPVEPVPQPAPPPAASADLVQRLAQLRSQAASAHSAFLSAAPRAQLLAGSARGSATGSDEWAEAQVALADLDSARSNAAIALGDLDILYVDATVDTQAREEIGAVRDEVIALIREEDAILAELRGRVGT